MNPFRAALNFNERHKPLQSTRFVLEIEGAPDIVKYNCREVAFSGGSLEVEELTSGSLRFSLPQGAPISRIETTFEIDERGEIFDYFRKWRGQVLNESGYFGVPFGPNGYARTVNIVALNDQFIESKVMRSYYAFPESLGQVQFSYRNNEAMEMQVTIVQFMPSVVLATHPDHDY